MKVINLFAGPGAGKSTATAGLFSFLKLKGFKVEMALEYAKDCVWEERHYVLYDQLYILAKQHRRLVRLKKHDLDYVITDSPLLLSKVYGEITKEPECFNELVEHKFKQFDNYNFYLKRQKPYQTYGRSQSEDEAVELDQKIISMLSKWKYRIVESNQETPEVIWNLLNKS